MLFKTKNYQWFLILSNNSLVYTLENDPLIPVILVDQIRDIMNIFLVFRISNIF